MPFIKSSMSGRISSLHISILIRSSTLKLQSGCWQRKRLVTRREEGQHCSNSFAASVAGALNVLKGSICHDEGGFNALDVPNTTIESDVIINLQRSAGASPHDWPFASLPWVSVTLRLA